MPLKKNLALLLLAASGLHLNTNAADSGYPQATQTPAQIFDGAKSCIKKGDLRQGLLWLLCYTTRIGADMQSHPNPENRLHAAKKAEIGLWLCGSACAYCTNKHDLLDLGKLANSWDEKTARNYKMDWQPTQGLTAEVQEQARFEARAKFIDYIKRTETILANPKIKATFIKIYEALRQTDNPEKSPEIQSLLHNLKNEISPQRPDPNQGRPGPNPPDADTTAQPGLKADPP